MEELSAAAQVAVKWPNAPLDAIHECYVHNSDESGK